jgi:hypothetical protein
MMPSICTTQLQQQQHRLHFSEAVSSTSSTTNNSNEEVIAPRPRRPTLSSAQSFPLPNTPNSSAAIRQALWVSRRLSTINISDSPTDSTSDYYSHLRKGRNSLYGGGEDLQRNVHPSVTRRASMLVRRMSMAIPTLSADPVPQSVC